MRLTVLRIGGARRLWSLSLIVLEQVRLLDRLRGARSLRHLALCKGVVDSVVVSPLIGGV